jgi:hypothetical protein
MTQAKAATASVGDERRDESASIRPYDSSRHRQARPAAIGRDPAGADRKDDQRLGRQTLYEPTSMEQRRALIDAPHQDWHGRRRTMRVDEGRGKGDFRSHACQ